MTATEMICILRKKGYRNIKGTTFSKKGTVVTVNGSSMEVAMNGIRNEYPFKGMKYSRISNNPFYEEDGMLKYIGI